MAKRSLRSSDKLLKKLFGQDGITCAPAGGIPTQAVQLLGFDDNFVFLTEGAQEDAVAVARSALSWLMRPGGLGKPGAGKPAPPFSGLPQFVDFLGKKGGTVECWPIGAQGLGDRTVGTITRLDGDVLWFHPDRDDVTSDTVQWVFVDCILSIGRYRPKPGEPPPGARVTQAGPASGANVGK